MAPAPGPHGRAVSGSECLYRALLAAYPEEFRRAHGREMAQVFRCMCREEAARAGTGGLARLWVRTLWELVATALAERINNTLGRGRPVGSSSRLVRWGGLATVAGGALLIAHGVLSWVGDARSFDAVVEFGSSPYAAPPILAHEAGYLLFFFGGLAGVVGSMGRAGSARAGRAASGRGLGLARYSAVAGLVLVGLAAAATVATLAQLATAGMVDIGGPGGIPGGSFPAVALGFADWLRVWGLPPGTALLGVAVLGSGPLGRWGALPWPSGCR